MQEDVVGGSLSGDTVLVGLCGFYLIPSIQCIRRADDAELSQFLKLEAARMLPIVEAAGGMFSSPLLTIISKIVVWCWATNAPKTVSFMCFVPCVSDSSCFS